MLRDPETGLVYRLSRDIVFDTRAPAEPANVRVTFEAVPGRENDEIVVPIGTRVVDYRGRIFETTTEQRILPLAARLSTGEVRFVPAGGQVSDPAGLSIPAGTLFTTPGGALFRDDDRREPERGRPRRRAAGRVGSGHDDRRRTARRALPGDADPRHHEREQPARDAAPRGRGDPLQRRRAGRVRAQRLRPDQVPADTDRRRSPRLRGSTVRARRQRHRHERSAHLAAGGPGDGHRSGGEHPRHADPGARGSPRAPSRDLGPRRPDRRDRDRGPGRARPGDRPRAPAPTDVRICRATGSTW